MREFDYDTDGFTIFRGLMPDDVIDKYVDFLHATFFDLGKRSRDEDYRRFEEIRDFLCHPVIEEKRKELGLDAGIEANLLNWSYEAVGWHADRWGNDDRQFGIFYSLDVLPPESGRFAIYPGSHNWDIEKRMCRPGRGGGTGEYLSEVLSQIDDEPYVFDGRKGDVLFWNGECIHRRLEKENDEPRKAAVVLCSDRGHVQHKDGFWYCV